MDTMSDAAVFNGSKILIWKQITTEIWFWWEWVRCIQWFKDTNLKANHNKSRMDALNAKAVFNGSKILIWKQITTRTMIEQLGCCCIQWFKDTNLKANHNLRDCPTPFSDAVFNGSKILIWKQITTDESPVPSNRGLYSMVQRY